MNHRPHRVLNLSTGLAGLYAGHLLSRHGFHVTRVEIDDPAAASPVAFDGSAGARGGLYRRWLERGSESIAATPSDVLDMLQDVDVVLSTFSARATEEMGLSSSDLLAANPRTAVVSITPFGLTGPRANEVATEQTLLALGGVTLVSGSPAGIPFAPQLPIPSILGGIYGAMAAAMSRLLHQTDGSRVDLSLLEIVVANTERVLSWYTHLEAVPFRGAGSGRLEQASGGGFLPAADGYFYIFSGYQWFEKVADMIGRPDLAVAAGGDPESRRRSAEETNQAVAAAVAELSVGELGRRAYELRMPSGPVNTVSNLPCDAQFIQRGVLAKSEQGDMDIRPPYKALAGGMADAGYGPRKVEEAVSGSSLPLGGVRVLDLSHAFAGPTSSRMLAEAGADVVKIESVSRLDLLARGMILYDNQTDGDWWDRSAYYGERNLGKKSLTLDMASPEGRVIFLRLLEQADVVVANFTPRVLAGWDLAPELMLSLNPALIVLMMTGFGMSGPKADAPALAGTMEAASGFSSLVRLQDEEPPGALGFNFGDMTSGVFGAAAVLFALLERQRTGVGQVIDFACAEAPISFIAAHVLLAAESGQTVPCDADLFHAGRHTLIETSSEPSGQRWVLAYQAEGAVDLEAALPELGLRQHELRSNVLRTNLDQTELVARLTPHVVAAVPLCDAEQIWFDSSHRERGLYEFTARRTTATVPYARAFPGLWDGRPLRSDLRTIPTLGESNASILGGELGLSGEAVALLEVKGVTGSRPLGKLPKTFQVPLPLEDLEAKGLIKRTPGCRARLTESLAAPSPKWPHNNEDQSDPSTQYLAGE